jgi:hypothetical protein
MASLIPKEVKKAIADAYVAEAQWDVALFTTNQCLTQSTYAGCTGEVPQAGGYTTAGKALSGRTATYSGTNVIITATNTAWTSATFSAAYVVVWDTGSGKIRVVYDLGGTKTVTSGTFTLQWDGTNGLIKIS